jgi:hypothetical protein
MRAGTKLDRSDKRTGASGLARLIMLIALMIVTLSWQT